MTGSLAYRKNAEAILRGEVPAKYTRLLPHIKGGSVLEIGSAEGVLACMMSRQPRSRVIALERHSERHQAALRLYEAWKAKFQFYGSTEFVNGDIRQRFDLLGGVDTLVAVRMIYYLRHDLDAVFTSVAVNVPNVVLCGNRQRAHRWREGIPDEEGGAVNYYASAEGMKDLLTRHGYAITTEITEGDPIVVGRR